MRSYIYSNMRLVWVLLAVGLLAILFYTEVGQMLAMAVCRRQNGGLLMPTIADVGYRWHANKFWHEPNPFPACTMDTCFNFSRCADMDEFRIFVYGAPYEPISYFKALPASPWVTPDANRACVFLIFEPESYSLFPLRPHPSTLPHWSGGLNHVIVSLADKWSETGPPSHFLGNASVMASCLQQNEHRPGFDISIPLPGRNHLRHLQNFKPWERRYFLTFKGTRYLGHKEGNFRSEPVFRGMHNGEDIIVAVTCRHVTNDRIRRLHPSAGKGCKQDEERYRSYDFGDLMNSTFGLAPAGRSPSSYRMIEIMSAGAIPVIIADNYVEPLGSMIQWYRCALQFPTAEMGRIVAALRGMGKAEMQSRQRYCMLVYEAYLKDDETLVRATVGALQRRFWGMFPRFNESDLTKFR